VKLFFVLTVILFDMYSPYAYKPHAQTGMHAFHIQPFTDVIDEIRSSDTKLS
jgi:hypothetical protein